MRMVVESTRGLWLRLRLNEAAPLLSLAGLSFCAFGFVTVAGEVIDGSVAGRLEAARRHLPR